MQKTKLTVIILTKNEAYNIRDCINSVIVWADEIIVVDDFSGDETVEIAESLGAKVLIKRMANEGRHRNWAYSQARNQWVLSLDADERLTPELIEEISSIDFKDSKFTAYTIPRRNHIGGYWLRYGGQYPSAQLKLFRRDKFKYEEVQVHPRAFLEGSCGHLKKDLVHYSYKDFASFMNKLNNQTTLEAQKWIDTQRQMSFGHALWRTIDRFFRKFIGKSGHRDGFIGFMLAVFDSIYQIVSYAKYWEIKQKLKKSTKIVFLDRDGVINKYPGHYQYVTSLEGFEFLPKSKESIAALTKAGFKIFVISNQACISKGLMAQEELDRITRYMIDEIAKAGGRIERVLYCIHSDQQNCNCRKPKTGLIDEAVSGIEGVNLRNSFFVGDSIRDIQTGKAVGSKTILVLSGRASLKERDSWQEEPDYIVKDIAEAAEIILKTRES